MTRRRRALPALAAAALAALLAGCAAPRLPRPPARPLLFQLDTADDEERPVVMAAVWECVLW